jgi:hypothetical protein
MSLSDSTRDNKQFAGGMRIFSSLSRCRLVV